MAGDYERGQPRNQNKDVENDDDKIPCGCHVKESAIFMASTQIVLVSIITLYEVYHKAEFVITTLNVPMIEAMVVTGSFWSLMVLYNALVIYGCLKIKPKTLLPMLLVQASACILSTICIPWKPSMIFAVIIGWVVFIINVQAYRYLNEIKKDSKSHRTPPPPYSPINV